MAPVKITETSGLETAPTSTRFFRDPRVPNLSGPRSRACCAGWTQRENWRSALCVTRHQGPGFQGASGNLGEVPTERPGYLLLSVFVQRYSTVVSSLISCRKDQPL